jgi:hypothetical protein
MSYQHPAQTLRPADNHRGLRLLALTAVVIGLMLLAAAAFVLSYAGIHEVALSAGVSSRWARLYPLIFDAMLVIACAAVLSLRGAGLPSRCYAWLSMLALFAAAAGADTVHAMGVTLPPKPAAAAAAIIPWALVLIGFGLLLCMLRQARLRRAAATAAPERVFPERPGHVEVRSGSHEARAQGSDPAGAAAAPTVAASPAAVAVTASASPATPPAAPSAAPVTAPARDTSDGADAAVDAELDLALEADPGPDDPASDEGSMWFPSPGSEQLAEHDLEPDGPSADRPAAAFSAAPTMSPDTGSDGSAPDPESDESRRMFLGLVAKSGLDGPPASQLPPHPRVAPEATFGSQPEPGPKPHAAPGTTPQPDPQPATEAALRPDPETGSEPGGGDDVAAQPRPVAEAEPEAATQPNRRPQPEAAEPQADRDAEPEAAEPQAGAESEPEAAEPQAGAEPEPEAAAARADTEPEPETAAGPPGPSPEPEPAPPDPRPAPDAQLTRHTPPQPRPAPESGTSFQPEPAPKEEGDPAGPMPGPEAAAGSTPTSGAGPEPESDVVPPPGAPQFDRMRSSPVPPEA